MLDILSTILILTFCLLTLLIQWKELLRVCIHLYSTYVLFLFLTPLFVLHDLLK
jgi:hypothetical protein